MKISKMPKPTTISNGRRSNIITASFSVYTILNGIGNNTHKRFVDIIIALIVIYYTELAFSGPLLHERVYCNSFLVFQRHTFAGDN